jgi:hypothetical protein
VRIALDRLPDRGEAAGTVLNRHANEKWAEDQRKSQSKRRQE